ncbi:MAG TPA: RHS repeat-associated core domain-containing protein, partial [Thermoanaerobaculia bacterium]|nr:RHS repeat-associated core domain-containing protein [Thermoanaerobaculia bacterium]
FNDGLLRDVQLPPVANTDNAARPTIRYGYLAAGGSFNDRVELATNLESITEPSEVATNGPARVRFVYEINASAPDRDRVKTQSWGTGESASFTWLPAISITDVLGQERRYTLTAAPQDAAGDRAHISELREIGIPGYAAAAVGQLPPVPTAGVPPITPRDRVVTFTFPASGEPEHPQGWAKEARLEGVRQTSFSFGSVNGIPAAHSLSKMQTLPLGGGGSSTSILPLSQPITRSWHYQQTAGAYLAATEINGARIESPEAHRYERDPAATNDNITAAQSFDEQGRPKSVTSSGGTDVESAGAGSSLEYFADDDPALHRRGLPRLVRQGDGGASGATLETRLSYTPAKTIEVDPRGVVTETELDGWRRVKRIRTHKPDDPVVLETEYAYDANGRVRQTRERKSASETVTTTYEYDVIGRRKRVVVDNVATPNGVIEDRTTYDLGNRKIVSERVGGATTTTELDKLGRTQRTLTQTNSSPIEQRMAYALDGQLVYTTDMLTAAAMVYDAHGRLIATRAADGTVTTTEYDDAGNVKATKAWNDDATRVIAETAYDVTPAGKVKSVASKVDANVTSTMKFAWDGGGRTTRSEANGRASVSKYDIAGRAIERNAGGGSLAGLTETFHSSRITQFAGTLPAESRSSDKSGATYESRMIHDAAGNVKSQSLGVLEWSSKHDSLGNVIESAEPNRPPAAWDVDARGAVKKETLPGGDAENRYDYAANGAQNKYTDPENEATETISDLIGRPVERRYKDGTREVIEWEGARVKSVTDRQNRKQVYVYNAKGQLFEIRDGAGAAIDRLVYDGAGRLVSWKNADSEIVWSDFNLAGQPKRTVQRRFANASGLGATPHLLDEFEQQHRWNEHGERTRFSMPVKPGAVFGAGWTKWVGQSYDAVGNLVSIDRRDGDVATPGTPVMAARYFGAGRPEERMVFLAGSSVPLIRRYAYDASDSRLTTFEVRRGDLVIAGSAVGYDGLQTSEARMLGVSSSERVARWRYDARSRVEAAVYGVRDDADPSVAVPGREREQVTKADFRERQERTPQLDAATRSALESRGIDPAKFDPPGPSFEKEPNGGHKIGKMTRGPEVRPFGWQGAERIDDGRFVYEFDAKGRLIVATEKTSVPPTRRMHYVYSGTGRVIGRRAEYTTASSPSANDWKLEDRPQIVDAAGLPADATFVWDPISDRLVSVFRAGATGDPLKQTIHGGEAYDDPLETATLDPSTGSVTHLYPLFDEAAAGSMQAVLNARGEVVARNLSNDPYGGDDVPLFGAAVDRISITAKKNDDGTLASVTVRLHTTEQLAPASVATGVRLAMVDTSGNVVTTSAVAPTLDPADAFTILWTLTGSEWSTLIDPANPSAVSLSIAATDTLRAAAWGADVPVLPTPEWARATRPLFTASDLPVELRESRNSLAHFLSSIAPNEEKTSTLYELETLTLAAPGGGGESLFEDVLSARFQALPFAEPATGLIYARARWYDPATGSFLSADSKGYVDSANLYAFAGGDPVNRRDPTGESTQEALAFMGLYMKKYDASLAEAEFMMKTYSGIEYDEAELTLAVAGALLEDPMNRLLGYAQAMGGCSQILIGSAAVATPEPTMATKIAGAALIARGIDNCQAGVRQIATGKPTPTVASAVIQSQLQKVMSEEAAARADFALQMLLDVGLTAKAGMPQSRSSVKSRTVRL